MVQKKFSWNFPLCIIIPALQNWAVKRLVLNCYRQQNGSITNQRRDIIIILTPKTKNRCTLQWWPLSPLSTHSDLKSEKSAILSKEAPTLTFFEIFFLTSHIHTYLFHYFTFLVQCAIFGKIFHFAAKKIDCTMVIFLCVTILNRIFYWTQTTLQKMPFSRKLVKKFFVREKEK